MIEMRTFKPDDAVEIYRQAVDESIYMLSPETVRQWAIISKNSGPAFTGICEGEITGCGGIYIKKNGVGNMWSIIRKVKNENKFLRMLQVIKVFDGMKDIMEIAAEEFGLKKLRSESRIGFEASQRLLEHLGFIRQRRNLINRNYYLYIREI